jgi:hypothetical protein
VAKSISPDQLASLDPVLTQATNAPSPVEEKVIEATRAKGVKDRLSAAVAAGPTTRQRTQSEILDLELVRWRSHDPFSVRYIPFDQLREMTTDLMLGFGWYFTMAPLIRADWSIESPDAQLAAAVDEAFRPISSATYLNFSNMLWYGHQPLVKRFKLGRLGGFYRDPQATDPDKDIPVWTSSADMLLWKSPMALNPSHCLPMWDEDGDMMGFKFSNLPIPNYDLISAASAYGYEVIPGHVIDDDYAMWITNEQELNFGCQPPDEPVLTLGGYVPIGELDPDKHRLVSYKKNVDEILRGYSGRGRRPQYDGCSFTKGERDYDGELLTISLGDRKTRVTPNHKLTVRWAFESEDYWAVYLMRRDHWWRIGVTRVHQDGKATCSGVGMRLQGEKATDAWVLGVFDSKRAALFHETLWSHTYHVPDLTFELATAAREGTANRMSLDELHHVWNSVDSETGARKLLVDRNLYEEYPLYHRTPGKQRETQAGWQARWTICAANLIPGLMELPADVDHIHPEWRHFKITREHYEGVVVSLDVERHHHYVTNGIITQNSVFGSPRTKRAFRYWWSYWYRWALADRMFENKVDPPKMVYYPTDFDEFIDSEDMENRVTSARRKALAVGEGARSGATVAMPANMMEGADGKPTNTRAWEIAYLQGGESHFADMDTTFAHLDTLKLRAWFVPEQAFIEGRGSSSSRNVAQQLGEVYQESQQLLIDQFDNYVSDHMYTQFIAANFPEKIGTPCRRVSRGLGVLDAQLRQVVLTLIGQVRGDVLPVDVRTLLAQAGIPLLNEEQMKTEIKNIAALAAISGPPQMAPSPNGTQGYNAGVEKTPMGESRYVQPPQLIILSESDGFMGDLPDTPHYKAPASRSSIVRLRRLFLERYTEQYSSFADFLEALPTLHLAEGKGVPKQDAKTQAATIVALWASQHAPGVPGHPTQAVGEAGSTAAKMADLMTKLAVVGGVVTLKGARLDASDFNGAAVSPWVTDRVGTALGSIDGTVSSEVQDWLENHLQESLDPAAAATAVREHFADFPATHADRVARTEAAEAYNHGTLSALDLAGVQQVQIHDASDGKDQKTDAPCLSRDGRVVSVKDAKGIGLLHPNCTLYFTALTTDNLQLERVAEFPAHLNAQGRPVVYDSKAEILYLAEDVDEENERQFLKMLGSQLAYR